ncbi:hypothetical protein BDR07DRAFT_1414203 [Suillus spraguei]|nr:hypothetical protein BDR07DRAFT_1414203 [Suillus spraguei]
MQGLLYHGTRIGYRTLGTMTSSPPSSSSCYGNKTVPADGNASLPQSDHMHGRQLFRLNYAEMVRYCVRFFGHDQVIRHSVTLSFESLSFFQNSLDVPEWVVYAFKHHYRSNAFDSSAKNS